jgi:hypothetical protein
VRTLDPWRANLFYVPAFTYSVTSNGGPPHDYIRRVVRFLAAEYPALWSRRGGRDHIFWATGDRGVCPLPPDLAGFIWLVHYGQTHASLGDGGGGGAGDAALRGANATCFDAQHGIVTPPLVGGAAAMANATYFGVEGGGEGGGAEGEAKGGVVPAGSLAAPRPTLLFFAGGTRMEATEYSQARPSCAAHVGAALQMHVLTLACSRVCRTAAGRAPGDLAPLQEPHRGRLRNPRARAHPHTHTHTQHRHAHLRRALHSLTLILQTLSPPLSPVLSRQVPDMGAEMRRAKFCLTPAGHGWGIRIVHAMATGCVPLIIQDGVHQPFDDVLPYHEFALRLPQADIPRLDDILRSVTPTELALLQRGVRRFHRAFIWGTEGGEGGEAFHWVVKSLQRRLHNVLAGF